VLAVSPDMEIAISILNTLGLGGVAVYIYFVFSGLKDKINTLQGTIDAQKETLEAVRERAEEFNRLSKGYKQALDDFEQMGKKIDERRQELVKELEQANQRKDEKLIEFRKLELQELELKQKSLEALPELEKRLAQVVTELDSKIEILTPSLRRTPTTNFGLLGLLANSQSRSTMSTPLSSYLASHRIQQLISNMGQEVESKSDSSQKTDTTSSEDG